MLSVDFSILNQKATPAIYADTLALRPSASFAGRLFVDTASPYGIYRDTGSAWVQIAAGTGGSGSTGVNGLNGTTNIGLGGTLTDTITSIAGNSKTFIISNTIYNNFSSTNSNITSSLITQFDYAQLQSTDNLGVFSFFRVKKNIQNTVFNGASFGLSLDDTTGKFVLGDYTNGRKYNSFVVNDDANTFYLTTSYNQVNNAQDLFYASNATSTVRFVKLGDFNNYDNQYSLIIDDANEFIKTTNANGDNGIILTNSYAVLGSYNSTQYLYLSVDYGTNSIAAYNSALTSTGLNLDFTNELYKFGSNNCEIKCDNLSQFIEFTTNALIFTDAALQSNTSGGNSGEHLVITLNGTQYKIKLENP